MSVGKQVAPAQPGVDGDAFHNDCPGREILNHVTSRWGVLLLVSLREGPLRFSVLRGRVGGISEKMLAQNLRVLVRDGLVQRTVEPATPPRVSYLLTALGAELAERLSGLLDWIGLRVHDVLRAQQHYDEQ